MKMNKKRETFFNIVKLVSIILVATILGKIYEAAEKARDDGSIIAIGHVRPNTLAALKIALPQLEKLNYHLVDIKKLIN